MYHLSAIIVGNVGEDKKKYQKSKCKNTYQNSKMTYDEENDSMLRADSSLRSE
jgi:hypothetical protein